MPQPGEGSGLDENRGGNDEVVLVVLALLMGSVPRELVQRTPRHSAEALVSETASWTTTGRGDLRGDGGVDLCRPGSDAELGDREGQPGCRVPLSWVMRGCRSASPALALWPQPRRQGDADRDAPSRHAGGLPRRERDLARRRARRSYKSLARFETASPEAPRFDVTLAERDGTIVLTIGYREPQAARHVRPLKIGSSPNALACRARTAGLAGLHPLGHLMEGLMTRVRAVLARCLLAAGLLARAIPAVASSDEARRKRPRARPGRRPRRSSRARSSTGAASGATGSGTATARPGRRQSTCRCSTSRPRPAGSRPCARSEGSRRKAWR